MGTVRAQLDEADAGPATVSYRGVAAGLALALATGWNITNIGAVAGVAARAYGVGLATVGLFTTALFLTHMAVQIPGGKASDRFGAARAGGWRCSSYAPATSWLLLRPSREIAIAARAVTGLGTGLAFIAGSALVREAGGSSFAQRVFGGVGLGAGGVALAVVPHLGGLWA